MSGCDCHDIELEGEKLLCALLPSRFMYVPRMFPRDPRRDYHDRCVPGSVCTLSACSGPVLRSCHGFVPPHCEVAPVCSCLVSQVLRTDVNAHRYTRVAKLRAMRREGVITKQQRHRAFQREVVALKLIHYLWLFPSFFARVSASLRLVPAFSVCVGHDIHCVATDLEPLRDGSPRLSALRPGE